VLLHHTNNITESAAKVKKEDLGHFSVYYGEFVGSPLIPIEKC